MTGQENVALTDEAPVEESEGERPKRGFKAAIVSAIGGWAIYFKHHVR